MTLIFTLFDDGIFSQGSHVYQGKIRHEHKAPRAAFIIKCGTSEFSLHGRPTYFGNQELLRGVFNRFSTSSGMIYGYNGAHKVGLMGIFHKDYYFIDGHTGIRFRWKTGYWGTSWKLVDPDGNKVASFKRKSSSATMQGRLTVHQYDLPEHVLALILLTQRLVHNRIKLKETKRTLNNTNTILQNA